MKNLLLDNVAAINEVRRTAEALKKGGVSLNGVSGPVKNGYYCSSGQHFCGTGLFGVSCKRSR